MEEYKKTGEDKNYEYYRSDSEVNSDDGDDDTYIKILNKRDEFNIKISNKEIKIKKRSLNKIMILSKSEPEEQVLFSLYKTISKESNENIKFKKAISNDPLSEEIIVPSIEYNEDNTQSILIQTNNLINIPENNNNNLEINNDNEDIIFNKKETNFDNNIIVNLPPEAIKTKWFYLLLAIIGIVYIIIFLSGIFNKDVGLNINIFSLFLFGIFIFFTGCFGFMKINKRIYDNIFLIIFTFICLFAGICGSLIVKINEKTERYFVVCLVFGIICAVDSLICFFLMNKLRKNYIINRVKKLERLM